MCRLRNAALVSLLVLLPGLAWAESIGLEASRAEVGRYEKIEFSIHVEAKYNNPFDPQEADISLAITAPSGATLFLPAFWHQDFDRETLPGGRNGTEWFYPKGPAGWKARFAPSEVGVYEAVAVCKDKQGERRSASVRFESKPSNRKGFVRISPRDGRFLELDNGQPLPLIGQNLAFVGDGQQVNLAKAEEIFGKLSANGANFLRIWICCKDWATAIEARKSGWGRSWEGRLPVVPMPGEENNPQARKCLRIPAAGERALALNPTRPLAVRPATKYILSGRIRADAGAKVHLTSNTLNNPVLQGKGNDWTPFALEFTTGDSQKVFDRLGFRAEGGAAWLDGLSLKEAAGGTELLQEADVNLPERGYYHPVDCFIVDKLVEAAERNGLYLQLCFLERDLYMHALEKPESPEYQQAIDDAKRTVRYVAARWGYSTSMAVWEYVNEMNPGLPTDRFYDELGRHFEAVDPFRHLRATSGWGPSPKDWRHPRLDIAQPHFYIRPSTKEAFKDEVESVVAQIRSAQEKTPPGKAVLMAEFGLADDKWGLSPYMKQDESLSHFHNILWASSLTGASGAAQLWWWEQLERMDAYRHYKPLAAYLADVPFTTAGLKDLAATVEGSVRPVGLQGKDCAYVWLFNPKAAWWNVVVEKTPIGDIQGAAISIQGLAPGTYRVEWWDTTEGKPIKTEKVSATGKALRLVIPAFTRDIACKVRR